MANRKHVDLIWRSYVVHMPLVGWYVHCIQYIGNCMFISELLEGCSLLYVIRIGKRENNTQLLMVRLSRGKRMPQWMNPITQVGNYKLTDGRFREAWFHVITVMELDCHVVSQYWSEYCRCLRGQGGTFIFLLHYYSLQFELHGFVDINQ